MTTSDYLTQLQQDKQDLVDNLTAKGITGLTGDETFTELVPEVLNIPSGSSAEITNGNYFFFEGNRLNDYNNLKSLFKNLATAQSMFASSNIETFSSDDIDLSNVSGDGCKNMFYNCSSLKTISKFETGALSNTQNLFASCRVLQDIPILNIGNGIATSHRMLSGSVTNLTTQSLDNLLVSLANSNIIGGSKTLYEIFTRSDMSSYYPVSTIEALPHYQDFVNAGWSIGWS